MQTDRRNQRSFPKISRGFWLLPILCGLQGCSKKRSDQIAVIPRTTGTMLWEAEHSGAGAAGKKNGHKIYWNAPTREDDVSGQIALVEQVVRNNLEGLVLAPDQELALMTPVRRAVEHGVHTVIVGSPLTIPASDRLSYILNDDEEGGRIAAMRVGKILHGRGKVAVIGINPDIAGILIRARSFEKTLDKEFPGIHLVEKRMGTFNVPHEQQVAEEMLKSNSGLDVIVALMWSSVRGAIATIDSEPSWHDVKVIGFDPDALPFDAASLDSIVAQNTHEMGSMAVEMIDGVRHGRPMLPLLKIKPLLVTRENVDSAEVRKLTEMEDGPLPLQPDGSVAP
jgi:ribose transport system substrate-binding protein